MTWMLTGQWEMGNNGGEVGEIRKMAGEKVGTLSGIDTNKKKPLCGNKGTIGKYDYH